MQEGTTVYVKNVPDDGSRTPAKLVAIGRESVMVKYPHIGGTFTFLRVNVVDENDDVLPFRGDEK